MKRLILIGGPMGVGKTCVCRQLQKRLPSNVFLDGDWCWEMKPFQVTEETKRMVMENIHFLLGQFLRCSAYENILFCWVMHQNAILQEVLSGLDLRGIEVRCFTLMADAQSLTRRVLGDVAAGLRDSAALEKSLRYLECCQELNTEKMDTSGLSAQQVAEVILHILNG